MNLKIRSKIILISIFVSITAISANTVVNSLVFTTEYTEALKSNIYSIGEQLRSQLDRLLSLKMRINEIWGFEEQCRELVEKYPVISYAMVTDLDGKILFHSDNSYHDRQIDNQDVLTALKTRINNTIVTEIDNVEVYDSFVPVFDQNRDHIAAIRIGFGLDVIKTKTNRIIYTAIGITTVFIILGSLLIFSSLQIWIARPINRLMEAINQIKDKGRIIDTNIPIVSNDELGKLSESFNLMAMELLKDRERREQSEAELARYKDQLEDLVEERTTQLRSAQQELVENAHRAGMADIAVDSLHNIGNILNSVRTSATIIEKHARMPVMREFKKANQLIRDNLDRLNEFCQNDPKGKLLMTYYLELEKSFDSELDIIDQNIKRLNRHLENIIEVIAAQQQFAEVGGLTEYLSIVSIIEDALNISAAKAEYQRIKIIRQYIDLPKIPLQKTKLLFILNSIFNNAKDAMLEVSEENRTLTISLSKNDKAVTVAINDTGIGIEEKTLKKIFASGFTTKKGKNGFALHSCANYMSEMEGNIWAESDGKGKGATFYLNFPLAD